MTKMICKYGAHVQVHLRSSLSLSFLSFKAAFQSVEIVSAAAAQKQEIVEDPFYGRL